MCGNNPTSDSPTDTTESGIRYMEFTIDGMPCLYITSGAGNSKTGGPTCDWSKRRSK